MITGRVPHLWVIDLPQGDFQVVQSDCADAQVHERRVQLGEVTQREER